MVVAKPQSVPRIEIELIDDPAEMAESQREAEQFKRNWEWLKANASEIYPRYRGKYICVAEQEVFASDDPEEAWQLAESAHPDDEGVFSLYLPLKRAPHLHANQW